MPNFGIRIRQIFFIIKHKKISFFKLTFFESAFFWLIIYWLELEIRFPWKKRKAFIIWWIFLNLEWTQLMPAKAGQVPSFLNVPNFGIRIRRIFFIIKHKKISFFKLPFFESAFFKLIIYWLELEIRFPWKKRKAFIIWWIFLNQEWTQLMPAKFRRSKMCPILE